MENKNASQNISEGNVSVETIVFVLKNIKNMHIYLDSV